MAETAPAFKPAFQIKNENKPICPECGSQRLFRDGFRRLTNGKTVQRWLCRSCGFRFSWPRVERQHGRQNLKTKRDIKTSECSSGALALLERRLSGAMNENEEKTTSGLAGATTTDKLDVKGKILEFAWYLKKNAYAESTVTRYIKALKTLQKLGADILNPENVKNVIAIQK